MKIFRIDNTHVALFRWLDPWNCLERIEVPGYFAVGAALEEDGEDTPAGLMCCFETPNRIIIEWICTDPGHRYERIGEELIIKAYEIAAHLGKEQVGVLMDHSEDREAFNRDAKDYFMERLFEEEVKMPGLWKLKLSNIRKLPWLSDTGTIQTQPLGGVSPKSFRNFINTPKTQLDGTMICKFDISGLDMKALDENLSRVILEDDEICGLFAVIATDNSLVPVALYSESEQETKALLGSSAQEALSSFDPDTPVTLVSDDKRTGELLEVIAPGKSVPEDLLLADVSDYLALLEN